MKTFIYILIAFATGLVVFNAAKLDFENLFQGDSSIAMVSILSGLCAILALLILLVSRSIAAREKQR